MLRFETFSSVHDNIGSCELEFKARRLKAEWIKVSVNSNTQFRGGRSANVAKS